MRFLLVAIALVAGGCHPTEPTDIPDKGTAYNVNKPYPGKLEQYNVSSIPPVTYPTPTPIPLSSLTACEIALERERTDNDDLRERLRTAWSSSFDEMFEESFEYY